MESLGNTFQQGLDSRLIPAIIELTGEPKKNTAMTEESRLAEVVREARDWL